MDSLPWSSPQMKVLSSPVLDSTEHLVEMYMYIHVHSFSSLIKTCTCVLIGKAPNSVHIPRMQEVVGLNPAHADFFAALGILCICFLRGIGTLYIHVQ